jgi:hypothetical protein
MTLRLVGLSANRFIDEPACSKPDQKIADRVNSQTTTRMRRLSSRP